MKIKKFQCLQACCCPADTESFEWRGNEKTPVSDKAASPIRNHIFWKSNKGHWYCIGCIWSEDSRLQSVCWVMTEHCLGDTGWPHTMGGNIRNELQWTPCFNQKRINEWKLSPSESWFCTLEHYSLGLWPLFKYNMFFITRSSHLHLSQLQQSWPEPQEPELHPHCQMDFHKSRKSLHSLEDIAKHNLFHSTEFGGRLGRQQNHGQNVLYTLQNFC